jgi:hypothetical protein
MAELGGVDQQQERPRPLGLLGEQHQGGLDVGVGHFGGRRQPPQLQDPLLLVVADDAPTIPGHLGHHSIAFLVVPSGVWLAMLGGRVAAWKCLVRQHAGRIGHCA